MGAKKKKIFIVSVPYLPFKQHLLERGWIENPDFFSPYFDLKYCVRLKDIDYKSLHPRQMISHFLGQNSITNKFELSRSLINLAKIPDVDMDTFFPRCYDLNCFYDHSNFLVDYKITFCVAYLKKSLLELNKMQSKEYKNDEVFSFDNMTSEETEEYIMKILISMTCILRYVDFLENKENIADIIQHHEFDYIRKKKLTVTQKQWGKTMYYDYVETSIHKIRNQVKENTNLKLSDVLYMGGSKSSHALAFKEKPIQSEQMIPNDTSESENKAEDKFVSERVFDKNIDLEIEQKDNVMDSENDININNHLLMDVSSLLTNHGIFILSRLKALNPQYNLLDTHNLWILKPNGLSRGRGIRVFQNLEEIEAYWVAADSEMVAMKYIERPFLIKKRKFDIRHWVVVTCLDPLCVWSFQDYYIRLSLNDYDEEDSRNIYAHLTNNSVAKKNKDLYSQIYAHSMLFKQELMDYCKSQSSLFDEKAFHQKMHNVMILSLESGKFNMLPRKKSFTVFGFDLMVDTDFNIWLIEVNSSPSMDTNTNVTEKIVPEFFDSLVQGVCDHHFVGNPNFEVGNEIGKLKLICKKTRGYNI